MARHSTEKNILVAFILNLSFAVFECIGGLFTGSIAILSDSVHDLGDALSIGISWLLEKKSRRSPDSVYTYGYARYSVVGGVVMAAILLSGSVVVIFSSVKRIFFPVPLDYSGMIILAVIGVAVNFFAAYFTHGGDSLNQKSVNLHMLEDVLGWVVVLVGSVVMHFTDISIIDPIMSLAVAVFILMGAVKNLRQSLAVFLEKTPVGISVDEIRDHICKIGGITDVHHIHIWTIDGQSNYATMHVVTDSDSKEIKTAIRTELGEHGIGHVTVEIERTDEVCAEQECHVESTPKAPHHHH